MSVLPSGNLDSRPDSIQWGGPTTEMTMKKMFVLLVVVAVALIVAKQVGHEH